MRKIGLPNDEWGDYVMCLLLHMVLPLLPLLFETLVTKAPPSAKTVTLTTALYAISIGLSSENKTIFSLCLFIGFVFSVLFGLSHASNPSDTTLVSYAAIALVFITHAAERYNRHVIDCRPFLEFMRKASGAQS